MSSISSVGSSYNNAYAQYAVKQGRGHSHRSQQQPDPTQMASDLVSQFDTTKKGYLDVNDLTNALSQAQSSSSTSNTSTTSAQDAFSALDSDSNGQLTKDELATALKALDEQLKSQFSALKTQQAQSGQSSSNNGDQPPPPPHHHHHGQSSEGDADDQGSSNPLSSLNLDSGSNALLQMMRLNRSYGGMQNSSSTTSTSSSIQVSA